MLWAWVLDINYFSVGPVSAFIYHWLRCQVEFQEGWFSLRDSMNLHGSCGENGLLVVVFPLGHFEFARVVFTSFASFFRVSSFFFFSFLIKFIIKSRS